MYIYHRDHAVKLWQWSWTLTSDTVHALNEKCCKKVWKYHTMQEKVMGRKLWPVYNVYGLNLYPQFSDLSPECDTLTHWLVMMIKYAKNFSNHGKRAGHTHVSVKPLQKDKVRSMTLTFNVVTFFVYATNLLVTMKIRVKNIYLSHHAWQPNEPGTILEHTNLRTNTRQGAFCMPFRHFMAGT